MIPEPTVTGTPRPDVTAIPTGKPTPGSTGTPTPEPTVVSTPEPTAEPTTESTAVPSSVPTSGPGATPDPVTICEMITPYLVTAATGIDINECGDPTTPLFEDPDTGYNVYVTNLRSASTFVFTQGDDGDIQFSVYFNEVTGDIFFDCSCSCVCLFTGGDAYGILSADAFIVTGTISCTTNPDGDLTSYGIVGMNVLVDNMSIETDNSSLNSFIEQNMESFGAAYLPCLEGLIHNTFTAVLDTLLI